MSDILDGNNPCTSRSGGGGGGANDRLGSVHLGPDSQCPWLVDELTALLMKTTASNIEGDKQTHP